MKGSDALVTDDVTSVSITETERTPCAKRRFHRKKRGRAVNASQKDAVDGTATTGESAVGGATSLVVAIADLDSEELDWSLPSLVVEQTEYLELKHIYTRWPRQPTDYQWKRPLRRVLQSNHLFRNGNV